MKLSDIFRFKLARWNHNGELTGPDGTTGRKVPYIFVQEAIPVAVVSSGTIGNNGALSGITALPMTYSNGVWIRLPAGAVYAGSAAGLWWAKMSSTTVGTIYNVFADTASPFTPYIPASDVPLVSTGPGTFTQSTATPLTLLNVTIPGGTMGANGALRWSHTASFVANTNSKILSQRMSGTEVRGINNTSATQQILSEIFSFKNRGDQSRNLLSLNAGVGTQGGVGSANSVVTPTTIDTSTDKSFTYTAQLAVATDWVVLECVTIEVLPF